MKASWARVALNLQVVVTFAFDVLVAEIHFNSMEIAGCVLLFLANLYLVMVSVCCDEESVEESIEMEKRSQLVESSNDWYETPARPDEARNPDKFTFEQM